MRVLDLFSGIGGFSLGLERAGMRTVAFCEIDPFCRAVLAKHWPGVPCHGDVTTRVFEEGEADVVVGGFPCQDISFAGRGAGLSGTRSGLYRELMRAIRVVRPRYAIVENVAALLSRGLGTVLGDLAEGGYDAEWDCVPACAVGAPHERDRVWIVAHADSKRCGEAGEFRHQPFQISAGRAETGTADAEGIRCRQGRARRLPDSFAGIRDAARRNTADPYGARLAFREGFTRDAWEKLSTAERDSLGNVEESIWPDEPALSGVDDGISDWLDRTKATGNAVVPQIPEIIGRTIMKNARVSERDSIVGMF